MKRNAIAVSSAIAVFAAIMIGNLFAQKDAPRVAAGRLEYATIRWAGKDNTYIVRPSGEVEFIGNELRRAQRPDRADERAFYMNLAMNGLAKEGYELAGMTTDEIVMKRAAGR